jgi:folate-dependent phosphoribosylglycinamide formyltransferase PurN
MESALFFYDKEALVVEVLPKKPVRILFLTSLRDIALEEYNGQSLKIGGQDTYIKGVIEKTLEETRKVGSLKGLVEVSGVIVDDVESDLKGKFPLLPVDNDRWIFPTQLLSKDSIWNIPSYFRKLPKEDVKGRIKLKYQFESLVFEKMQEIGADVLITDSYMARIEYLYNLLPSRVINIHPGPTLLSRPFCFRGKDPIGDAIKFAKINGGPVYTGATLHLVNERIDDGKFIAYVCNTPVNEEDDELKLMNENYQKAKLPIFVAGLKHYILKIYPYLNR